MIRPYKNGDEDRLKANEFSKIDNIKDVFLDDTFVKHTLEDKEEIKCIICWKQYAPKQYAIFFLMPEGIEFRHARALKRFLDDAILKLMPKSCITYSVNCDMLNRWHVFFGFKQQRKNLSDVADGFNKWLIKWA